MLFSHATHSRFNFKRLTRKFWLSPAFFAIILSFASSQATHADDMTPVVDVTDSGVDVVQGADSFTSSDVPVFTVSDPTISTEQLTEMVQDETATVLSDPEGVLTPEPVVTPDLPSDGNDVVIAPVPVDTPEATVEESNPLETFFSTLLDPFAPGSDQAGMEITLLDPDGAPVGSDFTLSLDDVVVNGEAAQRVTVHRNVTAFRPGVYTLHVVLHEGGVTLISEQDFAWGVLALNTDKTVYTVGDTAYLQMGVLNSLGITQCNADLNLTVVAPSGAVSFLSSADGSIVTSPDCGHNTPDALPDYYAHSGTLLEEGSYSVLMTATTSEATRSVESGFDVGYPNFDVVRTGPTRIFPFTLNQYPMSIDITPLQNWSGTVTEVVPAGFTIFEPENGVPYDEMYTEGDMTILSWNLDLSVGQRTTIGYRFEGPQVSPQFFMIGPLQFMESDGTVVFEETHYWQIADDAACNAVTSGNWSAGGNWSGCTGAGGIPATTDTVTINAGVTMTVDSSQTVAGITIASPTTSNGISVSTGVTLTDTGNFLMTGNATANTQTVTLNGTGGISVTGTFTINAPTSTGASNVTCAGGATGTLSSAAFSITGNSTSTGAVTVGMLTCTLSATSIAINGGTNATGTATLSSSTGVITATSGITMGGTVANAILTISGAATVNLTGTLSGAGTTSFNSGSTLVTTGTAAIGGAYTLGNLTVSSGTTTMQSFAITVAGATSISGTLTNATGATLKTFTGLVTVNAGGSFLMNVTTNPTLSFGGGITMNGTSFNAGTGTLTLSGTAQTFSGNAAMTFGQTVTIVSGLTLTNSNTNTITFAALTLASPTSANGLSLSTGSTTTVSGALTFTADGAANNETVTMNGTANLNAGSIATSASTSTGKIVIIGASGASGTLNVTGTTALTGSGVASSQGVAIDFGTNSTSCVFTTSALTLTAGTVSGATVSMGSGTLTANGAISLAAAASGTAPASITTTTGNITIKAGLTMSGTVIANAKVIVVTSSTITLTGTMSGAGTLTLTGVTFKTTGTSNIGAAYTLPNLEVLTGTTTMSSNAITISGATVIDSGGTLTNATGATLKTFTGDVTVNSGGSFLMNVTTNPTLSFGGNITMNGTSFNTGTGTMTLTGTTKTISGGSAMTFGQTMTIPSGMTLTNSNTSTVTIAALTLASPTSAVGLSLSTGSTTSVTGALTLTANAAANNETVTMNGTANLNVGSISSAASTSTGLNTIVCATGASGTLTSTGTITLTGSGVASSKGASIDFSTNTTTCNLTTNAMTLTAGTVSGATVGLYTGAYQSNGLTTLTAAASGTAPASLTTSTGNVTFKAGLTFSGTVIANAKLITGAALIKLTGTMSGAGTTTISSATFQTTGTAAIGAAYTLPNLEVLTGTTTMNSFAITISGATTIDSGGTLTNATGATLKTFTGLLTVNSGGSFLMNVSTGPTLSFAGGIVNNGTSFNSGTSATSFTATQSISGGSATTIGGATTISTGATLTISNSNTTTFTSTITISTGNTGLTLATGTTVTSSTLTFTTNSTAGSQQLVTLQGSANYSPSAITMPATTSTGTAKITATSTPSGTLTVSGTTTITGSATASGGLSNIDFSGTAENFITTALTMTAGTQTGVQVLMGSGTLTTNGTMSIGAAASGSALATVSVDTSTVNIKAGIVFSGATSTNAQLIATGAATVKLTGTISGGGTLTLTPATFQTTGTAALGSNYTLPNLEVLTGTTTFQNFTITVTGATTIDSGGTLTNASGASLKTFTGLVTVNSGGSFLMNVVTNPALTFSGGIVMNGTSFNAGTGTLTLTGTTQTFSGNAAITFGQTVTVPSGLTLTISNTNTVTMAALIISSPTATNNLSLATGSNLSVTGAITYSANSTANNQSITMNDTANLTAASFSMSAPTSTGNSLVTCASGATGTFNVGGPITLTGNSGGIGEASLDMLTCTLTVGGVITLNGGSNATGTAGITTSTGIINANGGITFGSTVANATMSSTGAATINLVGTMSGLGTLSFAAGTDLKTSGTTAINSAYTTLPSLWVTGGTTTMGAATTVASLQVDNGAILAGSTFLMSNNCSGTGVDGFTINGTFSGSGGTTLKTAGCTLDGTGSVTNTGDITFQNNKTIAVTAVLSFGSGAGTGSMVVSSGTVTNNGSVALVNTGTGAGLTGAGGWTQAVGSTLSTSGPSATALSITTFDASTNAPNTVIYAGSGQTVRSATYSILSFNNGLGSGGASVFSSSVTVNTTLVIAAATQINLGASGPLTLAVGSSISGANTTTSVIQMQTGNSSLTIGGTGADTVNLDCTGATGTPTPTVTYNNTAAGQTVDSTTYYNLTIASTGQIAGLGGVVTVNNNLTVSSGTLDDNGFQITGNSSGALSISSGATLIVGDVGTATTFPTAFTTGNSTLSAGSLVKYSATVAQTISGTPAYGNLQLSAASGTPTKTLGANLTVNGGLTIDSNNTLDVSVSLYSMSLAGDFTNNGAFTARTGAVTLSGTSTQTLTGNFTVGTSSAFYDLVITNNSGANPSGSEVTGMTASVVFAGNVSSTGTFSVNGGGSGIAHVRVQYHTGSTYTFNNISWKGLTGSGNRIYFRNSAASGTWLLNVSGTQSVSYVDVSRSDASGGNAISAVDGTNTDSGSDTNWNFSNLITISGTANGNNGATVKVAIDNAVAAQTATISGGTWSISNVSVSPTTSVVTVWVDGVADANETTGVTLYNGSGDITGMVLNTTVLTVGSNQNSSVSLTNLSQYSCADDEDVMHSDSGTALLVQGTSCAGSTTNAYTNPTLSVLASNTLAVGTSDSVTTGLIVDAGTITSTGTAAYILNGTSGTLFTVTGTFTPASSSVTLSGNGSATINSGVVIFYDLTSSGTGTKSVSASSGITVNHDLTVSAGTFDPNTSTVTGSGTNVLSVSNGATVTVDASSWAGNYSSFETRTLGASSVVDYELAGTQTVDSTLTYGYLTVSGASGTKSLNGTTTVSGILNVSSAMLDTTVTNYSLSFNTLSVGTTGTLKLNASAVSVTGTSGTLFAVASGGILDTDTSTVTVSGNGGVTLNSAALTGGNAFYYLTGSGTGTKTLGAAIEVTQTLSLSASTLSTSGSNYAVTAGKIALTGSGAFTANGSTITLNGTSGTLLADSSSGSFSPGTSTVIVTSDADITFTDVVTPDGTTPAFHHITFAPVLTGDHTYSFTGGSMSNALLDGNFTVSPSAVIAHTLTLNTQPYVTAVTSTSGTVSVSPSGSASALLDLSTTTLSINHVTIGANGTLSSDTTASVLGDWSNAGTYDGTGGGTVTFTGSVTSQVTGATVFNNLIFQPTGGSKELDFSSNPTHIVRVNGDFQVLGDATHEMVLRSDVLHSKWHFYPANTASSVSYVDVQDGGCESGAISIIPSHGTDSGNNDSCWRFNSISFSLSGDAVDFGSLSTGVVKYATSGVSSGGSAGVQVEAHTLTVNAVSSDGYTVSVMGASLNSTYHTITPIGGTNTAPSSGTDQFGLRLVASGGTGSVTAPYAASGFAYGADASTMSQVAHATSGDGVSTTYSARYVANVASSAATGSYTTSLTYVVTGNF